MPEKNLTAQGKRKSTTIKATLEDKRIEIRLAIKNFDKLLPQVDNILRTIRKNMPTIFTSRLLTPSQFKFKKDKENIELIDTLEDGLIEAIQKDIGWNLRNAQSKALRLQILYDKMLERV